MKQTVRVFDEQYLLQSTADLLALRAEIQKLKDSIQAAEAQHFAVGQIGKSSLRLPEMKLHV